MQPARGVRGLGSNSKNLKYRIRRDLIGRLAGPLPAIFGKSRINRRACTLARTDFTPALSSSSPTAFLHARTPRARKKKTAHDCTATAAQHRSTAPARGSGVVDEDPLSSRGGERRESEKCVHTPRSSDLRSREALVCPKKKKTTAMFEYGNRTSSELEPRLPELLQSKMSM